MNRPEPKKRWQRFVRTILAEINDIDKDTPDNLGITIWSEVEAKWWVDMMEIKERLQDTMNNTHDEQYTR